MNFIKGKLHRAGDNVWVEADGGVRLPAEKGVGGSEGQDVVYGVRPEHMSVVEASNGGVPATVTVVEPTGADTYVYAQIAGEQVCAVFDERYDFAPDQVIHLQPKLAVTHLFDAATGNKLN
jgi:multiple sugar transport system ATP-binding protein